ncbi:hypothetical protein PQR72_30795 [Paraburkholderia madseniana]|uniref:hypothetical protein n=1 Tax=Paraburkholderia madseniana TaxID=2599607 RepID=UPI0015C54DB0|nr:hypothetical protein [Paraburkholderia madseniana]NPT68592.1 hypothetical protein [Paraburkholderia madseniana]
MSVNAFLANKKKYSYRCIIPIKPEHIDAWLNPDPHNLAAQYAILDDRERPYYEHRMAA